MKVFILMLEEILIQDGGHSERKTDKEFTSIAKPVRDFKESGRKIS